MLRDLLEEGKEYFGRGEYGAALDRFAQALELDPGNGFILFEMGKTHYVLKEYRTAAACLEKSFDLLNEDAVWRERTGILRAKAYAADGEFDKAVKLLEELRRACGESAELNTELRAANRARYGGPADVRVFGGDYAALAEEYGRKVSSDPHNERAVLQLAQLSNMLGRYEETVSLLKKHASVIPADNVFLRNVYVNELELAEGRTVLESRVRCLTVTLSNRCNLSCIMCVTRNDPWELPAARQKEIAGLFPYLEKVMWQGGEVFFLESFPDLLKEASLHPNLRQSIVTNGQLITRDIAETLVTNNVELTFSIDSTRKETYERVRRGASFEKLLENIGMIAGLRKRHAANFVMNMNVAVMGCNYRELDEFVEFAARHGFEFLCLMPINADQRHPENIFAARDAEALRFIASKRESLEQAARACGIRIENRLPSTSGDASVDACKACEGNAPAPEQASRPHKRLCHLPWHQLLLDYDGTIRPDCLCRIDRNSGSLRDVSIAEAWNGTMMQEYRARMLKSAPEGFCNEQCLSGRIAEAHLKLI